jgi:hypothetical protein
MLRIDEQAVMQASQRWARLISRAWTDPEFHQRLMASPRAAVEETLGDPLEKTLEIRVVQDEPGVLTLVIPPGPAGADPPDR